ncbi:MAG: hypothetical protein H0T89_31585 [Deltaproteobacteria bacterium]|nr:hypothetical protein [Deltaproteobacteria bacterium]
MIKAIKAPPLSYTNRRGQVYYLHAGTTKTGKRRYFVAKTVGKDVLAEVPAGFEIVESINGVVSIRRIDPNARSDPDTDLARVRAELARHAHLRRHRADVVKGEIMVFEPVGGLPDDLADYLVASLQLTPGQLERRRPELEKGLRYTPVMRFAPIDGRYALFRMTYRGDGGWSRWALDRGRLEDLASKYLKQIGTPGFFELP